MQKDQQDDFKRSSITVIALSKECPLKNKTNVNKFKYIKKIFTSSLVDSNCSYDYFKSTPLAKSFAKTSYSLRLLQELLLFPCSCSDSLTTLKLSLSSESRIRRQEHS